MRIIIMKNNNKPTNNNNKTIIGNKPEYRFTSLLATNKERFSEPKSVCIPRFAFTYFNQNVCEIVACTAPFIKKLPRKREPPS